METPIWKNDGRVIWEDNGRLTWEDKGRVTWDVCNRKSMGTKWKNIWHIMGIYHPCVMGLIGGELPRNRKYGISPQFSLGAMLYCKWGSSLAKGS